MAQPTGRYGQNSSDCGATGWRYFVLRTSVQNRGHLVGAVA
jgi:hypothetical protein